MARFRVWQTKYAKIGVAICWDQWFPEVARSLALLGAEILFYPTAVIITFIFPFCFLLLQKWYVDWK